MNYDAHNISLADTAQVLQERHPDLTPEEHRYRILTAVHEASHMISAMCLYTGRLGGRAFIRVPRKPTKMWGMRGVAGKVASSAECWDDVIVSFAGIAAAVISNDPDIKKACASDINYGMKELRNHAGTCDEKTMHDIRHELLTQAFQIVAGKWQVIDLTATAFLLDARKDGGLEGKRFDRVVDLVREAMNTHRFKRDVFFPVPSKIIDYVKAKSSRPSRIVRLERPYRYNGYPYQQKRPTFNLRGPVRGNHTS